MLPSSMASRSLEWRGTEMRPSVVGLAIGLLICSAAASHADEAWDAYQRDDYATALRLWRVQSDKGDVAAPAHIGDLYLQGSGVSESRAEAFKWYRLSAERGFARAQSYIGDMYRSGNGTRQDKAQAVLWYRKAAEQGFPTAMNALGDMYNVGEGVAKDEAEAQRWYQKFNDAN
ncbi:tetratricopeptide repeat protein [Bosea sp. BE125]|uniref:tetratricopeptide repeat protein n=1 Tax=Bosea sp. BE125 TaxID=2817909 RepID=UPI00286CD3D5|nr:tetratricopeptide repeat protein [Bosea sp. BE125]